MADAGQFEQAEDFLRNLIEQAPTEEPYWLHLGQICRLRGDGAGARAAVARASALNPDSANARVQTAIEDFNLGRIIEAVEAMKPLMEQERPTSQALETLASFAEKTDDFESALALRRGSLAMDASRLWAQLAMAWDLVKLGRDDELADVLTACEARFGMSIELPLFRARLLKERADVAGACALLNEAAAVWPDHFDLWADRVSCMTGCGMFAEAGETLAKPPPCSEREKIRIFLLRGQLAMAQWDADRAYEFFAEGLRINPSDSWTNELAARAALLRADASAALGHIATSVSTSASHRIYHRGSCRPHQLILGQLADEYRLDYEALAALRTCLSAGGKVVGLAELVRNFPDYTPTAIAYLTALRRSGAAPALALTQASDERPIPRQVAQYWDADIPEDVRRLCDAWSRQPGFAYHRFSAVDAAEFIRKTGADDALAAFRRAREPTRQADLFRLFLLYHCGGYYIDADDRRLGPIEGVNPGGKDLIICLEDWGTAGNNFLAAAPRNLLIARALKQAMVTINSSDNEMVWLATGPGLLSRCLDSYIAEDPALLSRTMILDKHELSRAVGAHCATSHKHTRRHWTKAAFGARNEKSLHYIRQKAEEVTYAAPLSGS